MQLIRSALTTMAAGLILAGSATAGAAQVPVTKESRGEVMPDTMESRGAVVTDTLAMLAVRIDTVHVVRVDTITIDRITIRTDTITLYDTVTRDVPMVAGGKYYWGLAGGGAIPGDNLEDGFDAGFNVSALAGWRANGSPWGLRLDAAYNQLSGGTIGGSDADDASIMSGMLDATFDVPWGAAAQSGIYLLGGVGVHRIGEFDIDAEDIDDDETDGQQIINAASTDFGVNAGLGFRFGVGNAALFLEGRWVNVFTETNDTRYYPVTLGITF